MEQTPEFEDFEIKTGNSEQGNNAEQPAETPEQPEKASVEPETTSEPETAPVPEDSIDFEPEATPATEEATEPESSDRVLLDEIEALKQQNELLLKKFDAKIAQDEHKAMLFDKMYDELQRYKSDLYAKLVKPFILSTITLLDDTNTFLGKLGENEAAQAEKYLRSIPDDIVDILEANGVILYEDDSEKFNPRTQRSMKQVPTDNPDLDNTIARRLRKGYNWNGTNIRPELVWIYKYKPAANSDEENK